MKSGKRVLLAAGLLVCGAAAVRGELERWVQHVPAGPVISVLFRSVAMPGGAVPARRPPAETRAALTKLIAGAPRDAMLYRLRAQEAELALDFTAAESDWKAYVQAASGSYQARIELADFYHRRLRPKDEIAALSAATGEKDDPLLPAAEQNAWRAFERMESVIAEDGLPAQTSTPVFRAWVARYPKEPAARRRLIQHLTQLRQFLAAGKEIAAYGRDFHDELAAVKMRAELELKRGDTDAALSAYDQAFQPVWPEESCAAYFKLLEEHGQLRDFVGRARTALRANPTDLDSTARLFHYFRSQNNAAAARRALLEYRMAKDSARQPWTAAELETSARLFERLPDVNEAARLYYALYSLQGTGGGSAERALYGLAHLLLAAPEQPIRFGSGDLSFYKDIATVDPSPGFLNGILSLVLNSTGIRWEYERQDEKSAAYFHRAAASQLVGALEQRFPRSAYRAPLRAALVSASAGYGDDAAVVRAGRAYLATFPAGAERFQVAMEAADALARQNKEAEEFALYDQLLRELAGKATGVPIGSHENVPPQPSEQRLASSGFPESQKPLPSGARSPEYVQTLDRYLSRLASLNRSMDALRVYRTEIDRNPNDPGLYERLATFLDQNGMARDVEETYRRAIAKFPDRSWYHKLARWYLRDRQSAALEKISREAVSAFSGSELESYFADVVSQSTDAALYRQLNLYAHERFPEDMAFVHNLLTAYSRQATYDGAAAERLLRQYWFYDQGLRNRLFSQLAQQGTLLNELGEVRKANPAIVSGKYDQALASNPAAVQFAVEAEAWLCHFEAAAPGARVLATAYPGRREFTDRATSLYRSLAAYSGANTEIAASLAELEQRSDPRDSARLARVGDVFADRELFARARPYWERIASTKAGKPEAYLEAATVYWDYYLYDDSLRWIAAARTKFKDPSLNAYQAGAIYEGKRNYARAVGEYLAGALVSDEQARRRLIRLSKSAAMRNVVDRTTAAAVAKDPSWEALSIRIEALDAQQRRQDLEALLRTRVEAETKPAVLTEIREVARKQGFDEIEKRASEREASVTNDPVDKMRLTLATARLYESRKDIAGASKIVDALYRDNPLILGVVRGAVDFHVRNKQSEDAVRILLASAKQARADLANQFTLEAGRVATSAGRFDEARGYMTQLLSADPYRPEYVAAMAETYLRAKDDRGFRDYELAAIQQLKGAPLGAADRTARISAIRRALIPALSRLSDDAGAVAQYIELINNYPEDEGLTRESAAYAVAHGQAPQLTAFYRKTVEDAPRDYRWAVVLGRVQTVAEDYPAAIEAYERALKARPDKPAVLEAKARLEERLMRFDQATASYTRLYELTYRDPQWLIKTAELHARQGRPADSVAALRTAVIGARSETADADFEIAERLESWRILTDAVQYAERGAKLRGSDLLSNSEQAKTYFRIMAKGRRLNDALGQVARLAQESPKLPALNYLALAAGAIVADSYTPEEKLAFEQVLNSLGAGMPRVARDEMLLPFAAFAGLTGLESRWRYESMTAAGLAVDQRFVSLESERGLYGELGRQLEQYAAQTRGGPKSAALAQAAQAYVSEGDINGQLRTMQGLVNLNGLSGALMDRYLRLLAAHRQDDFLALARSNDKAAQVAVSTGPQQFAYAAIRSRGDALPPVWTSAYTALAGVYFNDRAPAIGAAFDRALDIRTIGERIAQPSARDSVIAGRNWFYYGARYGEYLTLGKDARAEIYMPAGVEGAPGSPAAYLALGDFYAGAGQGGKAIAAFDAALQLDHDRGDAHDHAARVLWADGQRDEALARWKAALAAFLRIESRGVRVPEPFWGQVAETFTDIGEHKALSQLRGDIERLLNDYIHRNGGYRLHALLEPAARASFASGQDLTWMLALYRSANNDVLQTLSGLQGLTPEQRIALQRYEVAARSQEVANSHGVERSSNEYWLRSARSTLVSLLLDAGDVTGALVEWNLMPAEARMQYTSTEVHLSARAGTLDQLIARYRAEPERAPSAGTLREASMSLKRLHDDDNARTVLEFVYDREIANNHLDAANFLGLAEIRLERNDAASALRLVNRMALVADDAFDTLVPAADLLTKFSKTAEAEDFLKRRVTAVPWDSEAKLRLARLENGADRQRLLAAVAGDSQAAYRVRAEAATASRVPLGAPGTELALLSGPVSPTVAQQPYFVESRVAAARSAVDPETRLRLWREALALAPDDQRVRLGAIEGALALKRDAFALSASRPAHQRPSTGYGETVNDYAPHYQPWNGSEDSSLYAWHLDDAGRSSLALSLGTAAQREDELGLARDYFQHAMYNAPPHKRAAIEKTLHALEAEQDRRSRNAARQPVIRAVIDQDQIVRLQIPGGTR